MGWNVHPDSFVALLTRIARDYPGTSARDHRERRRLRRRRRRGRRGPRRAARAVPRRAHRRGAPGDRAGRRRPRATTSGRCSTTSSGPGATRSASASCTSTSPPRSAGSSIRPTSTATSSRRTRCPDPPSFPLPSSLSLPHTCVVHPSSDAVVWNPSRAAPPPLAPRSSAPAGAHRVHPPPGRPAPLTRYVRSFAVFRSCSPDECAALAAELKRAAGITEGSTSPNRRRGADPGHAAGAVRPAARRRRPGDARRRRPVRPGLRRALPAHTAAASDSVHREVTTAAPPTEHSAALRSSSDRVLESVTPRYCAARIARRCDHPTVRAHQRARQFTSHSQPLLTQRRPIIAPPHCFSPAPTTPTTPSAHRSASSRCPSLPSNVHTHRFHSLPTHITHLPADLRASRGADLLYVLTATTTSPTHELPSHLVAPRRYHLIAEFRQRSPTA